MLRDLVSNIKVSKVLAAANRTADANGASVDVKDHGSLEFVASIGASGDTLSGSVYLLLELEHSDDNSSFSDCADSDLSSSVTGLNTGTWAKIDDAAEDDDATMYKVGYKGNKRYVRAVANYVGTHTNGMPCAVIALQGHGEANPQS